MDALRKQASKLREQVAKQAVLKQFSTSGYESSDVMVIDEVELQRHQQLEKLYKSTREGRDFQKDIARAAEVYASVGHKHVEIGTKLSEDCYRYGGENHASGAILAKAAALYGGAIRNVTKEHEDFGSFLSSQAPNFRVYISVARIHFVAFRDKLFSIIEPLKAMASGAPLEDARGLAQRYSRLRHEAETLAAEISRRQSRVRESPILENTAKLQTSEAKMRELKANMAVLGKEAAAALAAVESQQQRQTFQRILNMVEAEKSFHLRVAAILDDFEAEMVTEKQQKVSALPSVPSHNRSEKALYFLAEAMYHFNATSEKELSLVVGDYVVVRQLPSPLSPSFVASSVTTTFVHSSHPLTQLRNPMSATYSAMLSFLTFLYSCQCLHQDGPKENAEARQVGFHQHMWRNAKTSLLTRSSPKYTNLGCCFNLLVAFGKFSYDLKNGSSYSSGLAVS
ncbi:Variant SH3 domain [Musa troglodytarum]|uniref:Variant SH3 domain n=1 Tax=Musa troglodytarum TaxID=320322 RepID=A0A9E7HHF4_9LILI|nr:Variant SH3 domain [Musa troglodytarum]